MLKFIVSLFLGMIPEVLYLTLFIIYAKGKKENKIKLFLLLALGYILLIMIIEHQFYFYLGYIIYCYLVLKFLYKSEIIDFFVIVLAFLYLIIIAYGLYVILYKYYMIYYIVDRIVLILPIFILRNKLHKLYVGYASMWNRNYKNKNKIKSLTLRNGSIVLLNILIILLSILIAIAVK